MHLRVPTRFTDGVCMAGLVDVCHHCWFSIAFLTHTLRSYVWCVRGIQHWDVHHDSQAWCA